MKKLVMALTLVIICVLAYMYTPLGVMVDGAVGQTVPDSAGLSSDDGVSRKEAMRKKARGSALGIPDIQVRDENGDEVWTGDILAEYPDNILVVHICDSAKPRCPRGDDKPHFRAVMDLQQNYYDDIYVVGYNPFGPLKKVQDTKEYYGVDYEVYTPYKNLTVETREDAMDYQAFFDAISGGDRNITCPSVVFIKDGAVEGVVDGLADYDEIEAELLAVMER